jgi:hypothetical protein
MILLMHNQHAQIVRTNARNVGGDIFRYRRSLAETDAFLGKIENRSFAFFCAKSISR